MGRRPALALILALALGAQGAVLGEGGRAGAAERWRPAQGTSWQIQFTGDLDRSVDADVFYIDPFVNGADDVSALHAKGRRVICYISGGSWEEWRLDAGDFPEIVKGKDMVGWPGEKWVDVRRIDLLGPIMTARLDSCKTMGFDAVVFDNVDGYSNDSGFPLGPGDQLAYNRFLAAEAHARGLSAGLTNDLIQVADLEPDFDFAINESCFDDDECDFLMPFIASGKAVLQIEYDMLRVQFCRQARQMGFSSIKKRLALDAWRKPCGELRDLLP